MTVCIAAYSQKLSGTASFYNEFYNGRLTTTEEVYDSNLLTAASEKYDLGTYLKVTSQSTGKSIIVRMNDRCSCGIYGRLIDLSRKAGAELGILRDGMGTVTVEQVPAWQQEQLTQDFIAQNGHKYPKLMKRINEKTSGYYLTASSSDNDYRPKNEGLWSKLNTRKWGVQVSSLTDMENVNGVKEALVKQLNISRDDVYVIVSQRNGKPLYRVVVGKFDSIEQARSEVRRLEDLGYPGIIQEHI